MNKNAYNQYKQVQAQTANPGKLLIMLYQGCIKFLNLAKKGIEDKDIEVTNKYLQKSQDIITELKVTLDFEKGGEIADDLDKLYDFMNRQLIAANIQKNPELIDQVIDLMKDLLETWQEVVKKNN
ncbi:flagellar protein FliS [Orenia metallireducens]|uniref:Flagellar protein FliS n=1 Tax=Orenia metallireducens TaxID=1413210 RepID=A0A285GB19_9FIRM|nr:flagellar export chaperone FliS [Orenia metallireducens]PRX32584.1 flagellar protein FliS [Orenia metallireducens]SNY20769.1 flagellar protein FliS [Orenia metallireducens]